MARQVSSFRSFDEVFEARKQLGQQVDQVGRDLFSGSGPLAHLSHKILDQEQEWAQHRQDFWGVPSGFPSWEKITKGLHGGEYTVLAARPSSGKTSMALQVALNLADWLDQRNEPGKILVFSPEMSAETMFKRMVGIRSRVSSLAIQLGRLGPTDRLAWKNAAIEIGAMDYRLGVYAQKVDIDGIRNTVEATISREPVHLVIVDYIQIVGASSSDTYQKVTEVSHGLRDLANVHDLPVLALSQLKQPQDPLRELPPTLYEIRGSGDVLQDADVVMTMFRPLTMDVKNPIRDPHAQLTVFKNRNGGLGSFRLLFHAASASFIDVNEAKFHDEL